METWPICRVGASTGLKWRDAACTASLWIYTVYIPVFSVQIRIKIKLSHIRQQGNASLHLKAQTSRVTITMWSCNILSASPSRIVQFYHKIFYSLLQAILEINSLFQCKERGKTFPWKVNAHRCALQPTTRVGGNWAGPNIRMAKTSSFQCADGNR